MKVLHLEDSALDRELVLPVLRGEWPGCEIEVADTRESFLSQLNAGGYDVVISDFSMANFNGLEALQLVRELRPELPFIFHSGTIGEDRAIEAMRLGANDYVLKDRPKRLVPAIKRAVEGANQVRERKAAEERLLRVQRLENIGMLAAGIAHDFNNVLAPVMMAVPLLRERLTEPMDKKILNSVERSAERGASLVKEILGFAHGVTGEPQIVQAKHLLRELIGIMRQTFPKTIEIVDEVQGGLWPLKVNPTQLHQILLNLCVNARDSMPDGGKLTVRATNCEIDELTAASSPGVKQGSYLLFEVADTGTGIPADVAERIWEPFFTTKTDGRGTGLGLSTVKGIVDTYKGQVALETATGKGTTFRIHLPATPGERATDLKSASEEIPRGNGELILVVEDDAGVRDLACAILTRFGYRVLAATDGAEALSLFAPRSLEVRAVITDLSMPCLDGHALTKVLRNLNPAIRVLGISGLADQGAKFQADSPHPFLAKPFSIETLLGAIQKLLSA